MAEAVNGTPKAVPQNQVDMNLDNLGYFLDGWADLVEGMGAKASEVEQALMEGLHNRKMKNATIRNINGSVSITSNERRNYLGVFKAPGFSTTVYVDQRGDDLYTSWKSFYNPVLNTTVLLAMLGVSAFIALLVAVGIRFAAFFIWLVATVVIFLLCLSIAERAGRFLKGNSLYFFFIEPKLFDAEDVTAINFAVHKTLLRALDSKGIDISKLRLKQEFKGGRRDETV